MESHGLKKKNLKKRSVTREKAKIESQISVSKCSKGLIQANIGEAGFKQDTRKEQTQ